MVKPDILLGGDETTVVSRLVVGIDDDSRPDIELDPDSSSLLLGGGAGTHSEGDLRLTDRDENVRIHASAGGGGFDLGTTRVFVHGDNGRVALGSKGVDDGNRDIELDPDSSSLLLGGGAGTHSEGDLRLADRDENVRIHASAGGGAFDPKTTRILFRGGSGTLKLGAEALEDEDGTDIADVTIRPKWATLTLGGGGGSHSDGDVKLRDRDGDTRIHLTGGKGSTFRTTRVEADGTDGSVRLGGAGVDGTLEIDGPTDDKRIRIGGYRTGGNLGASADDPKTRVRVTTDATLDLGGDGSGGSVSITDGAGTETVAADGSSAAVTVGTAGADGTNGRLFVGGEMERSGVEIEGDSLGLGVATQEYRSHRRIELDGSSSTIEVYDSGGNERITAMAYPASITLSALTQNRNSTYEAISLDADDGTITLSDGSTDTVVIDGENGDVQVGTIGSLVSTIQDLQSRIRTLESGS
jgi:hypothetical protein